MSDVEGIVEQWRELGIKYVRFEMPDTHGLSRSKTVPLPHVVSYAERGLNMYGGASVLDTRSDVVSGTLYNEERKWGDSYLHPDPDTGAVVPWVEDTARFICDAQWADGTPLAATPRHVFRRALEKARSMGYEPITGSEFEFYLLTGDGHEPLFTGYHIFNTMRNDWVPTIRRILDEMPKIGVDIITSNCEYAGSQWEINFEPGRALAGPDIAFTFKNGVKEIAKQDGYLATFMTKPFADQSGSGCHTHMSLASTETGNNVFGDDADPDGISVTCRYFIGGLMRYARAIDALVAPTVNCLRRRRRHTFSPTNVSWGVDERSSLVRVKGMDLASRHIEFRAPSAMSNPYLVGAAILSAGLMGIEEKLEPVNQADPGLLAEEDERFEKLPTTLNESFEALESEPATREFFGDDFVTAYLVMRRYEQSRCNDHVTDWEVNEYLEMH